MYFLFLSDSSLFLPLKCSICVSQVSSSAVKVVQCCIFFIFFIFYTRKSEKIQENILENTENSCSDLAGHPDSGMNYSCNIS